MRFLPYFLFSFLTFEDLGNRASDAGLKSHEAQLLTTPKMIAYMNGVFSMPRNNFEMCCDGICLEGWTGDVWKIRRNRDI